MATEKSRETAAQVWCRPETSHIVMDCDLAEAFAETLDEFTARVKKATERAIANLRPHTDASDFIRIQVAAGVPANELYGART